MLLNSSASSRIRNRELDMKSSSSVHSDGPAVRAVQVHSHGPAERAGTSEMKSFSPTSDMKSFNPTSDMKSPNFESDMKSAEPQRALPASASTRSELAVPGAGAQRELETQREENDLRNTGLESDDDDIEIVAQRQSQQYACA